MMTAMTDRGLPIVDGAPACPFVAFEDDRDARATSPDHRHRCYAEPRPAPRALAHQEAYCLSSAFPVCPTFQDWARREAARATAAAEAVPPAVVPGADPGPGATDWTITQPPSLEQPQRNPPREWSAPPPWLGADREADDEEYRVNPPPPQPGGGLAGSFADRLASGAPAPEPPPLPPPAPVVPPASAWRDASPEEPSERAGSRHAPDLEDDDAADYADADDPGRDAERPARRYAAGSSLRERDRAVDQAGPVWERPRRREAYPTIKTRMGLGGLSLPPIMLGVVAVALAAVALFFLPTLVGILTTPGSSAGPTGGPGSSVAAASPTVAAPTEVPAPTPQVYLVQAGDTMSKIANRFGVPLQALIDANKATIPNPDSLQIDQEVIIPASTPTSLPGVEPSPSPS